MMPHTTKTSTTTTRGCAPLQWHTCRNAAAAVPHRNATPRRGSSAQRCERKNDERIGIWYDQLSFGYVGFWQENTASQMSPICHQYLAPYDDIICLAHNVLMLGDKESDGKSDVGIKNSKKLREVVEYS